MMSVLSEAEGLCNGDRREDYGDITENMQITANLWRAYDEAKKIAGHHHGDTALDVCRKMELLKMARDLMNPEKPKMDNLIDRAGYIYLQEQILKKRNLSEKKVVLTSALIPKKNKEAAGC